MKKFFCIGLLVLFAAVSAAGASEANGPEQVRELLKKKVDCVLEVLEQKDLSQQDKRKKVESIVDPVFNYSLMAKLALGPGNWPRLSPEQKKTFSKRFIIRLKSSYFDKVSMYSGDSDANFDYGRAQEQGGKIHVPVEVKAGSDKIDIVYRFYRAGGAWKIYDVVVNGVSIIKSYRSQFDQVLSNGTVEDLLKELKPSEDSQESGN